MNTAGNQIINRNTERIFLLLITAVMAVLFYKMYLVLNADFTDVSSRLKNGTMININDPHPAQNISDKNSLYPIPLNELQTNSALSLTDQNPGY